MFTRPFSLVVQKVVQKYFIGIALTFLIYNKMLGNTLMSAMDMVDI